MAANMGSLENTQGNAQVAFGDVSASQQQGTTGNAVSYTTPGKYTLQAGTVIPVVLCTGINPDSGGQVVAQVQQDLARIQQQVQAQNEKNQELLRAHISQIRAQLDNLMQNNPYRGRRSIYAENTAVATGNMVAVEA